MKAAGSRRCSRSPATPRRGARPLHPPAGHKVSPDATPKSYRRTQTFQQFDGADGQRVDGDRAAGSWNGSANLVDAEARASVLLEQEKAGEGEGASAARDAAMPPPPPPPPAGHANGNGAGGGKMHGGGAALAALTALAEANGGKPRRRRRPLEASPPWPSVNRRDPGMSVGRAKGHMRERLSSREDMFTWFGPEASASARRGSNL